MLVGMEDGSIRFFHYKMEDQLENIVLNVELVKEFKVDSEFPSS